MSKVAFLLPAEPNLDRKTCKFLKSFNRCYARRSEAMTEG